MMNDLNTIEQAIEKVVFLQKSSCQRLKNASPEERIAKLKSIEKINNQIMQLILKI